MATAISQPVEPPEGNFLVQSPYDVPENQRYTYDNVTGVRTFLVYAGDKPFNNVTTTNPRTEVRLAGHDYSSGVWQFEGYAYVPAGTSGVSVMEIHNEDADADAKDDRSWRATTLMLRDDLEAGIYDRWFRVNVVHDIPAATVTVYIDGGEPRMIINRAIPSASHYFKFGVYMQEYNVSTLMESRWKNISVYTKPN